jgi:hypothetical protein
MRRGKESVRKIPNAERALLTISYESDAYLKPDDILGFGPSFELIDCPRVRRSLKIWVRLVNDKMAW